MTGGFAIGSWHMPRVDGAVNVAALGIAATTLMRFVVVAVQGASAVDLELVVASLSDDFKAGVFAYYVDGDAGFVWRGDVLSVTSRPQRDASGDFAPTSPLCATFATAAQAQQYRLCNFGVATPTQIANAPTTRSFPLQLLAGAALGEPRAGYTRGNADATDASSLWWPINAEASAQAAVDADASGLLLGSLARSLLLEQWLFVDNRVSPANREALVGARRPRAVYADVGELATVVVTQMPALPPGVTPQATPPTPSLAPCLVYFTQYYASAAPDYALEVFNPSSLAASNVEIVITGVDDDW